MRMIEEAEYDRLMKLDAAVRKVLSQRADDVCWRDIYTELASLVGLEFCPDLICDSEKFLANCKAFDQSLREGPYKPVFVELRPTYSTADNWPFGDKPCGVNEAKEMRDVFVGEFLKPHTELELPSLAEHIRNHLAKHPPAGSSIRAVLLEIARERAEDRKLRLKIITALVANQRRGSGRIRFMFVAHAPQFRNVIE